MPDLPTIGGGPGDVASTPASSTGITLTAHASANTKGSWTELIASTAYASTWLLITLGRGSAVGASAGTLVDVGVGVSLAEQVLIPNLIWGSPSATNRNQFVYLFPVRIAAGQRVVARCQSSTGGATIGIVAQTIASAMGAPDGLTDVEAAGANTGTSIGTTLDPGGSANTDVVAQLTASTGIPYRWVCLAALNTTDVAFTAGLNWIIDLMVGGAGSEVAVVNDLWAHGENTPDSVLPTTWCFPCQVAAGSRLAARARCSSTQTGDRVLTLVAYGAS